MEELGFLEKLRNIMESMMRAIHEFIEGLKNFSCWVGWHGPRDLDGFDGASIHVLCKWCGKRGFLDSQGNFCELENTDDPSTGGPGLVTRREDVRLQRPEGRVAPRRTPRIL